MLRAALVCHDDVLYLEAVLRSLGDEMPATVFLNRKAWSGKAGKWQAARKAIRALGAEIIEGSWDGESEHRAATIQWAKRDLAQNAFRLDARCGHDSWPMSLL